MTRPCVTHHACDCLTEKIATLERELAAATDPAAVPAQFAAFVAEVEAADKAATPGRWESILPGDARGQPVPYYAGLVAIVSHDPYIAIVAENCYAAPEQWRANALLVEKLRNHAPAHLRAALTLIGEQAAEIARLRGRLIGAEADLAAMTAERDAERALRLDWQHIAARDRGEASERARALEAERDAAKQHAEALERMIADLVDECAVDFDGLEKACQAATPGPWLDEGEYVGVRVCGGADQCGECATEGGCDPENAFDHYGSLSDLEAEANRAFAVTARSALPPTLFLASQLALYARADATSKADMRAFHLSAGPAMVRNAAARAESGQGRPPDRGADGGEGEKGNGGNRG